MSEVRINGVRIDKLFGMDPKILVDPVPPQERSNFTNWRGCHLGKIALNLMNQKFIINAGDDPVVHFADSHAEAESYARELSRSNYKHRGSRVTQWGAADERRFIELTGLPAPDYFPSAVIAATSVGYLKPSTYGAGYGRVFEGFYELRYMDDYSRAAFEEIFGLDIAPQLIDPVLNNFSAPSKPRIDPRLIEQFPSNLTFRDW